MKKIYQILLLTLLLSGCAVDEYPSESIPKNVYELSTQFIAAMYAGEIDSCLSKLDAKAQTFETKTSLSKFDFHMSHYDIVSSRIVYYVYDMVFGGNKPTMHQIDYEYEVSNSQWVYFSIRFSEENDSLTISDFRWLVFEEPLGEKHEFNFQGKSILHYLWILLTTGIPIFILVSVVFAFRIKFKRKWLWILFMLFGLISFSMNWTTGEIGFQIFSFRPLGAGYVIHSLIGPWTVSFAVPIGAILFWFKRRNILKRQNEIPIVSDLENNKEIV